MSNIIHKFADKLSGHEHHKHNSTMDEEGSKMSSQQHHQQHQQQGHMGNMGDMGSMEQHSGMRTDMGMGMGSHQRGSAFDDDEHRSSQTGSKNMRNIRGKDHYDEYDDDFDDSANMGGRTQFSTENSGYQMSSDSAMGKNTGMKDSPSEATQANWSMGSEASKGKQHPEYANDDW